MNDDAISSILIIAVLLLFSAYFSATETAFSSLNRTRLRAMAEKGNSKAALALSRSIARSFRDFEADPDALERARVQLLCLCEAACEKG